LSLDQPGEKLVVVEVRKKPWSPLTHGRNCEEEEEGGRKSRTRAVTTAIDRTAHASTAHERVIDMIIIGRGY